MRRVAPRSSLPSRVLGLGTKGAQRAAELTGVDQALEQAAENAIVQAVESAAFERALVRVLQGPAVQEVTDTLLQSQAIEQAIVEAIDSEMTDRIWRRLLDSEETQLLIERIAEAPEIRAAIAAQGFGLVDDLGQQLSSLARRLDGAVEKVAWWLTGRRRRKPAAQVGVVSRVLALAVDLAFVNLAFFLTSALLGLVISALFNADDASAPVIAFGAGAWIVAGSVYLVSCWGLSGQTPGMRFLRLRLEVGGNPRLGFARAFRRLLGMAASVLTLGAGFLGILLSRRRRGLPDVFAGCEMRYVESEAAQDAALAAP